MTAIAEPRVAGEGALHWSVGPNPAHRKALIDTSFLVRAMQGWMCDQSGRDVATLWDGFVRAGRHRLTWSGIDREGRAVSTGIYFIRAETPSGSFCGKVMFVSE